MLGLCSLLTSVEPVLQCATSEDLLPQTYRLIRVGPEKRKKTQTIENYRGWSWCYAMCQDTPSG